MQVRILDSRLRAEYCADFPRDETVYAHAIFMYLESRQVQFLKAGLPCPAASVPPVVFSEVMRDVDLFVSVTRKRADRAGVAAVCASCAAAPHRLMCFYPLTATPCCPSILRQIQ